MKDKITKGDKKSCVLSRKNYQHFFSFVGVTPRPKIFLPPEWSPQSAVQLTWPHPDTDWSDDLVAVIACFQQIAYEIASRQLLLVVCHDTEVVSHQLSHCPAERLRLYKAPSNDTWARDHSGITVLEGDRPVLLDFKFNGWGLKHPAHYDNQITHQLYQQKAFDRQVLYRRMKHFVLEGGSIESDGEGTLLTTEACLLSNNRNDAMSKAEVEVMLREALGLKRILWLSHGYLAGDDTDSHIDTLARFCDVHTIAYVRCANPNDEHYAALQRMEAELASFATYNGQPYTLVPLPMADAVYDKVGQRLPATYANFLILDEAVLLPFYGSPLDTVAQTTLQAVFTDRAVIGIPCEALIRQHGSLHCVTMQYPQGVVV